jgi:TatD DNase family protein
MDWRIIDTHCHLDIIQEQGQSIADSLEKAGSAGVEKLLQIGIDFDSSVRAKQIANGEYNFGEAENRETETGDDRKRDIVSSARPEIFYSIGCHPTETPEFSRASEIEDFILRNLDDPKLSAIGEIGIDLYHTADTKKQQEEILDRFLDLSDRVKLPVVIHSRDGFAETYERLKSFNTRCFGVIHCFTYDYPSAKKFVDLGYYISFSGIVTFKSAVDIQDAAKKLPLDSILIETDSPFLAPTPFRGKRNDSGNLPYILEKMFSLREEPNAKVAETLYFNSEKFLNRKAYYHA